MIYRALLRDEEKISKLDNLGDGLVSQVCKRKKHASQTKLRTFRYKALRNDSPLQLFGVFSSEN